MNLNDYTGVIHLHSSLSFDGHAPMKDIVRAAAENGIDFLMLTDHDHLRARDEGWEGWQGKVLVIVGEEIAPRFNHYLAFNIKEPVVCHDDHAGSNPQKYMDEVHRQGGIGFIAHPDHEGTKMFHVKQYSWNDWSVSGYTGIGIWDFMTDWQSSLTGYFRAFFSFFFPAYFLKGPRTVTLERWDRINQTAKVVGIGELDNHASTKKIGCFNFVAFSFDRAFRFVCTHILTQEPFCGNNAQDIRLVYDSLSHRRCYFSLEYFHQARGFQFFIEHNGRDFYMGDALKLSGGARLHVSCPEKADIRIIHNGSVRHRARGRSVSIAVDESGVYRTEVYLKAAGRLRPWIFSNPIFVN